VNDERHREAKRWVTSHTYRVRFPSIALTASFANSDIRQRVEIIFSVARKTELRKLLCPMMSVFNSGTNCLISLLRQNSSSPSPSRPSFLLPLHPNPRFSDKRPNAVERRGIHEKGSHTVRDESWCCTWLLYVAAGCTNTFTVDTYRT